jgi:hypothetical protein
MNAPEFDRFLDDLHRSLRLRPAQRAEIREELADHFHALVDELVSQGMPRTTAIRQALDEFGDAADLAHRFTRINHPRSWIMKSMLAASLIAAVSLGTSFLMPIEPRPGVGPGVAGADDGQSRGGRFAAASAKPDAVDPVLLKLHDTKVDAVFDQIPLEGCFAYLAKTSGVNVFVNWNQIEAMGYARDQEINLSLKQVSIAAALDVLSEICEGQIGYIVRDGIVHIGEAEAIERATRIIVYDCADLVRSGLTQREREQLEHAVAKLAVTDTLRHYGEAGADKIDAFKDKSAQAELVALIEEIIRDRRVEQLIDVICTTVDAESWACNGGNVGRIQSIETRLVVTQTEAGHEAIRNLLTQLRMARSAATPE